MTLSLDYLDCLQNSLFLAAAQTAVAPLERTKLLMQCEYALQKTQVVRGLPFQSFQVTFSRVNSEGFASLFRGNACNVVRAIPTSLVVYSRQVGVELPWLFQFRRRRDGFPLWFLSVWVHSCLSSLLFLSLVYPLEFCRTALACDVIAAPPTHSSKYLRVAGTRRFANSYYDLLSSGLAKNKNGWTFYSGFSMCAVSLCVYRAAYLFFHELSTYSERRRQEQQQFFSLRADVKNTSLSSSSSSSSSWLFDPFSYSDKNNMKMTRKSFTVDIAKLYLVSTAAGFVCYPFDTLSRWAIIHAAFSKHDPAPSSSSSSSSSSSFSSIAAFRDLSKSGGRVFRVLYQGAFVNVLRNGAIMTIINYASSRSLLS